MRKPYVELGVSWGLSLAGDGRKSLYSRQKFAYSFPHLETLPLVDSPPNQSLIPPTK